MAGIIMNKQSHLYKINGMENHLHILTDIHPSIAPADFMRDLKVSTSIWMKKDSLFPKFKGWAEGYGSFTCSFRDIDRLIEYIKNQQEHHRTFEEEFNTPGCTGAPGVIHIWLFQSRAKDVYKD